MKNIRSFLMLVFCVYVGQLSATVTKVINNSIVRVEKGDITQCSAEAMVNAANPQLCAGDGVCGAIFAAAGLEKLQKACYQLPVVANGDVRCPVGQARITGSFDLKKNGIKHIIHAVGPDCRIIKDAKEQDYLLRSCYRNALIVATKNNISSIAFPFISSAIYAFPKERAARIALAEIERFAREPNAIIKTITLVLYSEADYNLFANMITSGSHPS